jgi:membrane associated rhomboid family serine protease
MIDSYLIGARQRFEEFGGFSALDPADLPDQLAGWAEGVLQRDEPGLSTLVALVPHPPEGALRAVRDELAALADGLARQRRTEVLAVLLILVEEELTRERYSDWQNLTVSRWRSRVVPWVVDLTRQKLFPHDGPPFGIDPDLVCLAEPEPELPPESEATHAQAAAPACGYRFPWLTVGLVALLVLIWIAMTATGRRLDATEDVEVLDRWGALSRPEMWQKAEFWRLVTANFLHIGAMHLVMNSLSLWAVGRLVERFYGPVRMAAIFLLAGVAGMAVSAMGGPPYAISAGASGAILGLLGALVWYRVASPQRARIPAGPLLFAVAGTVVSSAALYYMMDNWNHAGGFVGGLVAAAVVGVPWEQSGVRPRLRFHWGAHLAATLLLVALAGAAAGGSFDLPGPGRDLARALTAAEGQQWAVAEAGIRQAVDRQSDAPGLRLWLVEVLREQGKCREARAEWAEARRLEPEVPAAEARQVERALWQCGA